MCVSGISSHCVEAIKHARARLAKMPEYQSLSYTVSSYLPQA